MTLGECKATWIRLCRPDIKFLLTGYTIDGIPLKPGQFQAVTTHNFYGMEAADELEVNYIDVQNNMIEINLLR